jgi:hypothetical protein
MRLIKCIPSSYLISTLMKAKRLLLLVTGIGLLFNTCIEDDVEEPEPPDFNQCLVLIRVYGYYHETLPPRSWDRESNNGTIQSTTFYSGNFTGNTFTGSYSTTDGTDFISGSISAYLNETKDVVDTLRWEEKTIFPDGSKTTSCKLIDVPMVNTGFFQVEGEESCRHIPLFFNDQDIPDGFSYTLTGYKCTSGSTVNIYFHKE